MMMMMIRQRFMKNISHRCFSSIIERTESVSGGHLGNLEESRVLVLYTGGTMGMKREDNGALVCTAGYLTNRLKNEILDQDGMPKCDIIEYDELIDSSFMNPTRWKKIASDIEKNYEKYDGFVRFSFFPFSSSFFDATFFYFSLSNFSIYFSCLYEQIIVLFILYISHRLSLMEPIPCLTRQVHCRSC